MFRTYWPLRPRYCRLWCFIATRTWYSLRCFISTWWSAKSRSRRCVNIIVGCLRCILSRSRSYINSTMYWPIGWFWCYWYFRPRRCCPYYIIGTWVRYYYLNLFELCFWDCPWGTFGYLFFSVHVISRTWRKCTFISKLSWWWQEFSRIDYNG